MMNLIIACGIPGSGKTTSLTNLSEVLGAPHISRDEVRASFRKEDTEDYFKNETLVFASFVKQIVDAMQLEGAAIADATHISRASRLKLIKEITKFIPSDEFTIEFIWFDTPLGVCLERNFQRKGWAFVPEKVIRDMNDKFEIPSIDEFDNTIIIRRVKTNE